MFLIVLFVGKLYLLNVKLPEGSGLSGSTLATAISLFFSGKSFADVVRANLGQKGHGQARPLVGTKVASKPGELLELFKEDVRLTHDIAHYAFKKKARSYNTSINSQNDNSIVCRNRFQPLMGDDLLLDDFDMPECEIQALDTVSGDTGQTLSSLHGKIGKIVTNLTKH